MSRWRSNNSNKRSYPLCGSVFVSREFQIHLPWSWFFPTRISQEIGSCLWINMGKQSTVSNENDAYIKLKLKNKK